MVKGNLRATLECWLAHYPTGPTRRQLVEHPHANVARLSGRSARIIGHIGRWGLDREAKLRLAKALYLDCYDDRGQSGQDCAEDRAENQFHGWIVNFGGMESQGSPHSRPRRHTLSRLVIARNARPERLSVVRTWAVAQASGLAGITNAEGHPPALRSERVERCQRATKSGMDKTVIDD